METTSYRRSRRPRWTTRPALVVLSLATVATLAQGCAVGGSSAGSTTCAEFAQMDPDTGLGSVNSKQAKVISDMLDDHNALPGQVPQAEIQVISYCNIYGGHAGAHANDPIDGIPGLQD